MASNKRINKAYIRYDGNGRVIPGALLLNRFKPTGGGKWHEIPAYECCNPVTALALRMLFSNILEVEGIVGDVTDVANWNTYFDLPTYGNPFTSVSVTGDEVKLYGGSNIIMKESLFDQADTLGTYLLELDDQAGSIIEVEYDALGWDNNDGCKNLVYINLPSVTIAAEFAFNYAGYDATTPLIFNLPLLTTIGNYCFTSCSSLEVISLPSATTIGSGAFESCPSLISISIPACLNLGPTVGDNNVLNGITGNIITLTVPSALMTCNSGNPDGDIQDLQASNTVTVITV